jgi:hypothetical protein
MISRLSSGALARLGGECSARVGPKGSKLSLLNPARMFVATIVNCWLMEGSICRNPQRWYKPHFNQKYLARLPKITVCQRQKHVHKQILFGPLMAAIDLSLLPELEICFRAGIPYLVACHVRMA